ncbi:hypothetical protein GGR56DRAFT_694198 [Xylariaceae sp. FL0804]|nr:hypothetical protein GGR56DRAFT_694198 [Xylariaceae sp. FL0804]
MPGQLREWPAWAEYGQQQASPPPPEASDADFVAAKRAVLDAYGADGLRRSWEAVCARLVDAAEEIARLGSAAVPVVEADQVLLGAGAGAGAGGFASADVSAAVRRTGCVVVRGTVPRCEAAAQYAGLARYVADNRALVRGWPAESPSMLMLYDTPAQNALRAHPRQLALQRRLNELWHDDGDDNTGTRTRSTSPDPLIYLDGLRDRPPGQAFLGLGPHIDAGSLSRWADPRYRRVYARVFAGNAALPHDPWDLGRRRRARPDLFPGPAHSGVLRTFQGWTALTRAAPGEGTLLVVPELAATIAYVLLRPFFRPPADPARLLDAASWTLDDREDLGWFPGTTKPQSQRLSRSSHPHLRLEQTLVHIPAMEPGDTVWWHTDLCHAVDPVHEGDQNAAVAYIAACPTTPNNVKYIKQQLADTLAGRVPRDYLPGPGTDETTFLGYQGHAGLSDEARRAFGYGL